MSMGVIGKKAGMTRIFDDNGNSIPVSVIELLSSHVSQVKTIEKDGYSAVQVAYGNKKTNKMTQQLKGHLAKAKIESALGLIEFKVDSINEFEVGQPYGENILTENNRVDATGISKGKGFGGVIKRHNFAMQDATHGNSLSHRAHGSIGQCQTPGRVFKGKKMAGHMGNVQTTVQSLKLVRIDSERKLLFIRGAIPGATGSVLVIKPAVKHTEGVK